MTHLPHIDYIQPTPLALAVRDSMYPTEHKGLKQWLGVIVAIAIPLVAPMLSGAIASSGFLGATATGFFSTVGGSALVGAGLGALGARVSGGDWKRGALMGGIGGYLGGAPKMGGAGVNTGNAATQTDMALSEVNYPGGDSGAAGTLSEADMMANAELGYDLPPGTAPTPQTIAPTTESALSNTLDTPQVNTPGTGVNVDNWDKFKTKLSNKFTTDQVMDKTIDYGIQAAGNALLGGGASAETQRLQAVVDRLEAQGEAVDAIKLREAKAMLQQALQTDSTYLARQRATHAKNQAANQTTAAVRNANLRGGGNADSIRRAGAIQQAKASGTGYDQGYLSAIDQKTKLQTAGLSNLPGSSNLSGYYQQLAANYKGTKQDADREMDAWAETFGNTYDDKKLVG